MTFKLSPRLGQDLTTGRARGKPCGHRGKTWESHNHPVGWHGGMTIGPSKVWQEVCEMSKKEGLVDSSSFDDRIIWEPQADKSGRMSSKYVEKRE